MKHISPQLGFNNNVRHRGRVFHIQTEDSGIKHPHIITHLFADGGRILKSQKVSYAEFLDEEELPKKVRALMQEQHKAMFMALRGGKFDQLLGDQPKEGEPAKDAAAQPPPARAPLGSLSGAAEFAATETAIPAQGRNGAGQGAGPAAEAAPVPQATSAVASPASAAVAEPPKDAAPLKPPTPSQPQGSSARLAALAAMDDVASAPRSRLTPPPPRAVDMRSPEPTHSPLRALASRPPVIEAAGSRPAPGGAPRPSARPPAPAQGAPPSVPPPPARLRPPSIRPSPTPGNANPLAISASLDLDLEALERAAEQSQTPVYKQIRDLPPPPATLLRPSPPRNTSYRSVTPQATQIVGDGRAHGADDRASSGDRSHDRGAGDRGAGDGQQAPRAPAPSRPGSGALPPSSRGAAGGRYAPSRPASIFGASRPSEGSSIFGEDLISEKSLDEVILSYLAEDLEGGPKK